MFVDTTVANVPDLIETDLCIIGSGAAGLTIANEFLKSKTRVVVLEAGGTTYSPDSQQIYAGLELGQANLPLEALRLRYYGGTTNHWTGLCRPLDDIDFEERAWVPHSGWPIRRSDLEPFLARTHEVLDLGRIEYALETLAPAGQAYFKLDPEAFKHQVWRISAPTRFGPKYHDVLEHSGNVEVLLNASVVDLVLDVQGHAVDHLLFKDAGRKTHKLRAKRYVLATGGIENARLLLASRGVNPRGIGNDHDCVGRYFHDHPHVYTGTLSLFDNASPVDYQHSYAEFQADTNKVLPAVVLAQPAQEREKTLRNGFSLFANSNLDAADSYLALRRLLGQGTDTAGNHSIWDDLKLVVGDLGGAYDGVAGKIRNSFHKTHEFRMFTRAEQAPNPDSRVTLNDERDANGMPRVTLDWRFTKLDKHTLLTANSLFGREIGRLGLGRVQLPDWLLRDDDSLGDEFHPGGHHMGTTRMAATPEHGVVDADCRVFGVANLYVGGSSVFPTGGYANPTLTIVQLALRMADHLKAELGSV